MSYDLIIACTVIISLVDINYNVTEPGTVEVGIQLTGGITADVTITIEIINATATGALQKCM